MALATLAAQLAFPVHVFDSLRRKRRGQKANKSTILNNFFTNGPSLPIAFNYHEWLTIKQHQRPGSFLQLLTLYNCLRVTKKGIVAFEHFMTLF